MRPARRLRYLSIAAVVIAVGAVGAAQLGSPRASIALVAVALLTAAGGWAWYWLVGRPRVLAAQSRIRELREQLEPVDAGYPPEYFTTFTGPDAMEQWKAHREARERKDDR